jgi:hypothetical protein
VTTYLNALPSWVASNPSVNSSARSLDNLISAYIFGLQVIGLSTQAFVDQAVKQGMNANAISPLLVKSESFIALLDGTRADRQPAPSSLVLELRFIGSIRWRSEALVFQEIERNLKVV